MQPLEKATRFDFVAQLVEQYTFNVWVPGSNPGKITEKKSLPPSAEGFLFFIPIMLFHVYIIYSESAGQFYKGQAADIAERLNRHNNGYELATARYRPWRLLWSTAKNTREESMQLERKLKNLSRERLIALMLKYEEGIPGPDELLFVKQLSGC